MAAIGVLGAWGIIVLLWTAVTDYAPNGGANVIETFTISANAGSFLVETIYIFLAVFACRSCGGTSRARRGWRLIAVLVGFAAPILAFKGSLDPFPAYPNNQAVWFWIGADGPRAALVPVPARHGARRRCGRRRRMPRPTRKEASAMWSSGPRR